MLLIFTVHQPGSSNQVEENKATEAEARNHTFPTTNSWNLICSPRNEKIPSLKRHLKKKFHLPTSICMGYVSFREGKSSSIHLHDFGFKMWMSSGVFFCGFSCDSSTNLQVVFRAEIDGLEGAGISEVVGRPKNLQRKTDCRD